MIISYFRRSIAIMLTVLVAVAGFALPASAAIVQSPFADGTGSLNNPYIVETVQQFNEIRFYASDHFQLGGDIDLGSFASWTPIGQLSGSLDGRGYVISGMSIGAGSDDAGLFGTITNEGFVVNLTIANSVISNSNNMYTRKTGALAGLNEGSISNVQILQVSLEGSDYTGGIVGVNNGSIVDSYVELSDISGTLATGGIAGSNTGLIERSRVSESAVTSVYETGGAVGRNDPTGTLRRVSYVATQLSAGVFGASDPVGGLVGSNSGTVEKSYVEGAVSGTSVVGGLIGKNGGSVADVYVKAELQGTELVGGVVGSQLAGDVQRAFSNSSITITQGGNGIYGALLGEGAANQEDTVFGDSYWNAALMSGVDGIGAGLATFYRLEGLDAQQLANSASFVGWDFTNKWHINQQSGMPELVKPLDVLQVSVAGAQLPLYFFPDRLTYVVHAPPGTEAVQIVVANSRQDDTVQINMLQPGELASTIPVVDSYAHITVTVNNQNFAQYSIEVYSAASSGGENQVDKTELALLIAEALHVLEYAEAGTEPGQYSEVDIAALGDAVAAAQLIMSLQEAGANDVLAACEALSTAIGAFMGSAIGATLVLAEVVTDSLEHEIALAFSHPLLGVASASDFVLSDSYVSVTNAYLDEHDRTIVRLILSDALPADGQVTITAMPGAVWLYNEQPNPQQTATRVLLGGEVADLRQEILAGDASTQGRIQINHVVQYLVQQPEEIEMLHMSREALIRFMMRHIDKVYS